MMQETSRWDRLAARDEPAAQPASRWDGLAAPAEPAGERGSRREQAAEAPPRRDRLGAGRETAAGRPAWATDPTSSYEHEPSGEFVAERRPGARPDIKPVGSNDRTSVPGQRNRDVNVFEEDAAPLELNLDEEPRSPEKSPRRFLRRK